MLGDLINLFSSICDITERQNKTSDDIKSILANESKRAVTVVFNDGDVQISKCHGDDEFDTKIGVALCLMYHRFGSSNKASKYIKEKARVIKDKKNDADSEKLEVYYENGKPCPYKTKHFKMQMHKTYPNESILESYSRIMCKVSDLKRQCFGREGKKVIFRFSGLDWYAAFSTSVNFTASESIKHFDEFKNQDLVGSFYTENAVVFDTSVPKDTLEIIGPKFKKNSNKININISKEILLLDFFFFRKFFEI